MRILAVGNMYPPHSLGGYELVWRSAVAGLRAAGHRVRVLTSDYRAGGGGRAANSLSPAVPPAPEPDGRDAKPPLPSVDLDGDEDVHRELRWYWREGRFPRIGWRARLALERANAATFDRQLADFAPDAVSWWAMGGMSLSLIERARRAGLPAAGFVHDDWLVYGPRVDAWMRLCGRLPRPAAALAARATGIPTRLDPGAAATWAFVSEHTRRRALAAGWRLPRTEVAHSGIDAALFGPAPAGPWRWRLLYAGRIDPRKGIDTAIEALARLPGEATLTLAGEGGAAELAAARALAGRHRLGGRVVFAGGQPREELAALYAGADAVLFPVRWQEPWGLVPLEAMAVGRPVVATATGGSAEYLRDGENCLLVPPGDAGALAAAVERLAGDGELRERLRRGGAETAPRYTEERFNRAVAGLLAGCAARGP